MNDATRWALDMVLVRVEKMHQQSAHLDREAKSKWFTNHVAAWHVQHRGQPDTGEDLADAAAFSIFSLQFAYNGGQPYSLVS